MNLPPDSSNENEKVDNVDDKNDDDTATPQSSSLHLAPLCGDVEAECSTGTTLEITQIMFLLSLLTTNIY